MENLKPLVTDSKPKSGFTLVELLVVIAVIGVLIAMLLPAVQGVREAARRADCSNRIKQLGLAAQSYHSSFKIFPDGGTDWWSGRSFAGSTPAVAPNQQWGVLYQLLPFIEQENLYNDSDDNTVRSTPVSTYFCPSRRNTTVLGGFRAMNDYVGNGGIREFVSLNHWGDGRVGGVIVRAGFAPSVRFADIDDGTSNTIIFGEKALHPDDYYQFSCSDNEGYTSGWDWDVIRWGHLAPIPDRLAEGCEDRFGSARAGGAMFGFLDGSVSFVPFSVDETVFYNSCHRNDGQTVHLN